MPSRRFSAAMNGVPIEPARILSSRPHDQIVRIGRNFGAGNAVGFE